MTKTFKENTTSDTYFFIYCDYDKVSNIKQLSDGNHKVIGGLSDDSKLITLNLFFKIQIFGSFF